MRGAKSMSTASAGRVGTVLGNSDEPYSSARLRVFTSVRRTQFVSLSGGCFDMRRMIPGQVLMAAVLLAGAGVAGATDKKQVNLPQGDDAVAKAVRHEVLTYP